MEKGLKSTTVTLMIATALFFDVLQAFLAVLYMGWLVGIIAGLTFWLWFRMHGISFIKKPSRLGTFVGTTLLETFPLLPTWVIPAWTIAVAYLAISSKIKETTSEAAGKVLPFRPNNSRQSTEDDLDRAA